MSFPNIPDVDASVDISTEDSVNLLLASIASRDFPVVQAIVVILALWVVVVNFIADVLYQCIDPRIRLS